jgi:hypothetical protein
MDSLNADSTSTEFSRRGRPHPEASSPAFYALERMSRRRLETALLRGQRPDPASLAGWEFRGVNAPRWAYALGIKKFIKGFFREPGGELCGFNRAVVQNRLRGAWTAKPGEPFGFYTVAPVDPTSRDNAHLHALLLDYGAGDNPRLDPSRGLRDYLVQVDASNPDLFLGKAYYAAGPLRIPVSFFILERHGRIAGA